jgi:putative transposase
VEYGVSIRVACEVLSISTTCYFYKPSLVNENAVIEDWLRCLTTTHKRWGFGLCFDFLRNIKGFKWNHKRVYRIKRDKPDTLAMPAEINQVWSMDFMSDSLKDGRSIRTFNVIDDCNRESLAMDFGISLPTQGVIWSLQQIIEWRGKPLALRCDNGPEFISHELIDWAIKEHITLLYIQPGKPTQNAYIERFNRTARHELLELNLFEDIEHAQLLATQWPWTYNNIRPRSPIGGVPPRQLL